MSGMAGPTPKVGQRVEALGKDCTGKIAYIGSTQFAQGKWIGEWRSGYLIFCVALIDDVKVGNLQLCFRSGAR